MISPASDIAEAYSHKVKNAGELIRIIGARPRQKRVVMCHGVFDLVHPGHLRHLLYAKSKGHTLIASLTADAHIKKAEYRPFVPQELRALNLAALEMVDYVVIDTDETPRHLIRELQPDIFAKGYEYQPADAETKDELAEVEAYGGAMLFTPGDVVYSSSAIIESSPPDISVDKLLALMRAEGLEIKDLQAVLDKVAGIRVHVVGDTIIDSLTYTTFSGMSDSPTPTVQYESRHDYLGGAAVVASHLAAAGAEVTLSTVLGRDPLGDWALAQLGERGIRCNVTIDPNRPTVHKNAVVCAGARLLRLNTLDNGSIPDSTLAHLVADLQHSDGQAIVFSDFRHGIFNRRTIPRLIAALPPAALKVADSQVASRWGNICDFRGFDLVTPNEREARFALADQDTGIRPLAERLRQEADAKLVIMKLGERGVLTCRPGRGARSFFIVDSFARRVVDPVGAGDALLAYATLAMAAGGGAVEACIIGSIAAGLECEADGNEPVSVDAVRRRLEAIPQ